MFETYLTRWRLTPDGAPISTHSSHLLPVRHAGEPAMLKLALDEEERFGGALMEWWGGDGAARVLAREDGALLMERAVGPRCLADMARNGEDDEASRVLCAVAAGLHAARSKPLPELAPLDLWFDELDAAATSHGGILLRSAAEARALLAEPAEPVALHGDLHHGNVLDFGSRGWLAIDPKRRIGARTFDYANIFTNPDLDDPSRPVAVVPGRLQRRLAVVMEATGIERRQLLRWILAWTGLSAAWYFSDGDPAFTDLTIAEMAAAELDR